MGFALAEKVFANFAGLCALCVKYDLIQCGGSKQL